MKSSLLVFNEGNGYNPRLSEVTLSTNVIHWLHQGGTPCML